MKIVITGGTGQLGSILDRHFRDDRNDHVVVVGRRTPVSWDGVTLGDWAKEIDGADVVINLAGRTVNCRYNEQNLRDMMDSRVHSTRVVGQAIARASRPPRVWLQMSTATIYAHRFDAANDEATGEIGGTDAERARGAPAYWQKSVAIAQAWEAELAAATVPSTTRRVALRTAMVMSPDQDGIFDVMSSLTRRGLGGAAAGGAQYVSWIHGVDVVGIIDFLIARDDVAGAVNLAAPEPLPQREFARVMREAWDVPIGLPATSWMLELGAFALRTDTELLMKSRRVVPKRLLDLGYAFRFTTWPDAAKDLVARMRAAV